MQRSLESLYSLNPYCIGSSNRSGNYFILNTSQGEVLILIVSEVVIGEGYTHNVLSYCPFVLILIVSEVVIGVLSQSYEEHEA